MKFVSIIMPIYATEQNGRLDLAIHATNSVLQQTYSNLVLIVVDDGSPISTKDLFDQYKDSRIRFYRREREPSDLHTASNARNLGMDLILGNGHEALTSSESKSLAAVTYVDSDDLLSLDSIEKRLKRLEKGFVYTDNANFSNPNRITHIGYGNFNLNPSSFSVERFLAFNHQTIMWTPEFLRKLKTFLFEKYCQEGFYDPSLFWGEDVDLSISSVQAALAHRDQGFDMKYVPFISYFYRRNPHSVTNGVKLKDLKKQQSILASKHQDMPCDFIRQEGIEKLLSDLPWSLFAFMPKPAKKVLRPIRDEVKRQIALHGYPELESLEFQIAHC